MGSVTPEASGTHRDAPQRAGGSDPVLKSATSDADTTVMSKRPEEHRSWPFHVKTTLVFLLVASLAIGVFAMFGLRRFEEVNETNTRVSVDRAARAAVELFAANTSDVVVQRDGAGSPLSIDVDDPSRLQPDPVWDGFVDRISSVNQGAANIFVFDQERQAFDRIATSFRTPSGARVAEGSVEPGLLTEGHPAFDDLVAGTPFVGQVPVAGRLRLAYLTPIVDSQPEVVGALAVDVGWVDDIERNNRLTRRDVMLSTILLLVGLSVAVGFAMTRVFRPLNRLSRLAHRIGAGEVPDEIPDRQRHDEVGRLANGLAAVHDLQVELSELAYRDQLTRLPNRVALIAELNRRLEDATSRPGDQFAMILLDVDQFKEVNDVLGHAAGDDLLIELATAIDRTRAPGEFVARLGGDEFAFLTNRLSSRDDAAEVAERLEAAVSRATGTSAVDAAVTCSSGIVCVPEQADTAALALSHADMALYRAKRSGRAQWQFYESGLSTAVHRRLQISTELRKAIDERQITLAYQPLFGASDLDLRGFEALARWNHPDEGPIPPLEFISVAENAGLINELGALVLDQTCAQARQWVDAGLPVPPISVNVSPIQLWQPDFEQIIRSVLDTYDLEPSMLTLEITESALVHHADRGIRGLLHTLAEMGVHLSIDDFGTGYSALSYLHELSFDQLKIDRSFVARAHENQRRLQLFSGVASLGRTLGLEVVAEGIESAAELEIAREAGCGVVQGYLVGRPLPPDEARRRMVAIYPAPFDAR